MRRRRLDADLELTAAELSDSRRRLVDAQDVERRRLERELHTGPEQQVLGLKLGLAEAAETARRERTERAAALVDQISEDAQHAIDQIRSLAQGIYPPLLESDGLGPAIQALADRIALDVRTAVSTERRSPLPIEAAVYFCVSEAMTNATKHGEAPIEVRVFERDGELGFEVADSGPGFDPNTGPRGSGLSNMADRLDSIGGTLTIESSPGASTTITGAVPLSVSADA
jgi:signal transduction histidine kinase